MAVRFASAMRACVASNSARAFRSGSASGSTRPARPARSARRCRLRQTRPEVSTSSPAFHTRMFSLREVSRALSGEAQVGLRGYSLVILVEMLTRVTARPYHRHVLWSNKPTRRSQFVMVHNRTSETAAKANSAPPPRTGKRR